MSNIKLEYKTLVYVTAAGYGLNMLCGAMGIGLPLLSYAQLLCFQAGDASAIMASVIAARYTGLRGQHVAASAFILLGITHGLSLASSGLENFNVEKGITLIMPMIPSMILIGCCTIFPVWLRAIAVIPMALFVYVYINVIRGGEYFDTPVKLAYASWMIIEILWSVYIYKDWKKEIASS